MSKDFFKSFTSYGKKVIPELTNDWEIYPSTKRDYFIIKSTLLGQTINVDFEKTFNFFVKNNIQINGREINANLIINTYGQLSTEEEYYEWEAKNNISVSEEIKKSDLCLGESYILDNEEKVTFLGSKYISNLKDRKVFTFDNITKISKKYLFYSHKFKTVVLLGKEKIYAHVGDVFSEDTIDHKLENYYHSNVLICYFEDINLKDVEYKYIDIEHKNVKNKVLLFRKTENSVLYTHADSYGSPFSKNDFFKRTSYWDRLSFYKLNSTEYQVLNFDEFNFKDDIIPVRIGIK